MRIAIIPARGGSKRIPGKNIRPFCGQPMIAWSIQAAQASGCFDRIIVSTDSEEIAEIARQHAAETPFMRPAALSDDHTGTMAVMKHAVLALAQMNRHPGDVCCIYATAPFLSADDISKGLAQLLATGAHFAFSVTSYPFPIQRAIRLGTDQRVSMFQPQHFNTRSQDLEPAWHDAGQFYWGTAASWLSDDVLFGQHSTAVVLPRYRVQDIDTEEDWERAEWMFKAMQMQGQPSS